MMKKLFFILPILLLAGCRTATIPITYQPQNIAQTEAVVHFRDVSYWPHEFGNTASNQIQNNAIGQIRIGEDIATLIRRANVTEFRHSGGTVDQDADIQIDIVIRRFFAGDLGYRVKWEMSTDYILHNSEGDMIYMHTINLEPRITGKFGSPSADYEPIVVNLIRETFESFMNDPEVQKILRNN